MLHTDDPHVRELLLKGSFGLERESLRVTPDGYLAQTPHPFLGDDHIVRDFSENQVEINTPVLDSPVQAVACLEHYDGIIQRKLASQGELLWPFSNPPYIRSAADIPVARFEGQEAHKTAYRNYLDDRYGRYKMTFSGIHFNYSFAQELLEADFAASGQASFADYKDRLYLDLAERCVAYGWLMTAVTAASPLMDSSFVEKKKTGGDLFMGFSSPRNSELGYWNFFAPILDYASVEAYAASIQRYIDEGLIKYPSELYYPIRIKPRGAYGLDGMRSGNLSHIELRMFDLNPLCRAGVALEDVFFAQLFLVWLASKPAVRLDKKSQVQAVQNFKNASRFDLKTVKIVAPDGEIFTVARAARNTIGIMGDFYRSIGAGQDVMDCLEHQYLKFEDGSTRHAYKVRERFSGGFVQKGLELARERQAAACG